MSAMLSPLAKYTSLLKRAKLIKSVLSPSGAQLIDDFSSDPDAIELGIELSLIGSKDADDITRLREKLQKQLVALETKITSQRSKIQHATEEASMEFKTAQCQGLLGDLLKCVCEIANKHGQIFGIRLARRGMAN